MFSLFSQVVLCTDSYIYLRRCVTLLQEDLLDLPLGYLRNPRRKRESSSVKLRSWGIMINFLLLTSELNGVYVVYLA